MAEFTRPLLTSTDDGQTGNSGGDSGGNSCGDSGGNNSGGGEPLVLEI